MSKQTEAVLTAYEAEKAAIDYIIGLMDIDATVTDDRMTDIFKGLKDWQKAHNQTIKAFNAIDNRADYLEVTGEN